MIEMTERERYPDVEVGLALVHGRRHPQRPIPGGFLLRAERGQ